MWTHSQGGATSLRPVGPVDGHLTGWCAGGSVRAGQSDSISSKGLDFCWSIDRDGGHRRQSCGRKEEQKVKLQDRSCNDHGVFEIFVPRQSVLCQEPCAPLLQYTLVPLETLI